MMGEARVAAAARGEGWSRRLGRCGPKGQWAKRRAAGKGSSGCKIGLPKFGLPAELGCGEQKREKRKKCFVFLFLKTQTTEFKYYSKFNQKNNVATSMQQTSSHLFIFGKQIMFLFFYALYSL
jgi:hypothetical protein